MKYLIDIKRADKDHLRFFQSISDVRLTRAL